MSRRPRPYRNGSSGLARGSVVSTDTIADFEIGSRTPSENTLAAIRAALEVASALFVDRNGDGPGLKLRKRRREEAALLNLTWIEINPTLLSRMSMENKDGIGPTRPVQRGQSILSPALKVRRVKNPRSHEEIITDAEKKFSKTIAYLTK
jgi:hypothetical protein